MSGRTNEESVFIAMSPSRIGFFTFSVCSRSYLVVVAVVVVVVDAEDVAVNVVSFPLFADFLMKKRMKNY
jgi:hypothetical protein